MKRKVYFVLVLAVFAGSAFAGPTGPYRLAFITSANVGAPLGWTINDFNAHVQNLADMAGVGFGGYITDLDGNPINLEWKVIGSTWDVDARDNTETNPFEDGVGVPIYNMDGETLIAENNADLWDSDIINPIMFDEMGMSKFHWPITGTYPDGTEVPGHSLSDDQPSQGRSALTDGRWIYDQTWSDPRGTPLPLYAVSEIIPEPATLSLFALGCMCLRRRRK